MTKHVLSHLLLIALVTLFTACDKNGKPTKNPDNNVPQYLLKAITWDNGFTATSSYNTDSTLQHIQHAFQSTSSRTVFGWAGKRLAELYDDASTHKQVFAYNSEGKIATIRNVSKTGSSASGYEMAFRYNSGKKVDSLHFYMLSETGKTLLYASGYHYSNAGELDSVVTKSSSSIFTHTIDTWSPPVSFNPAHYLDIAMNENYPVYNYAMLLQMQQSHKLPAKVTRYVKTGANPAYTDKIDEQLFSVTDHRIDSVHTTISYPGIGYIKHTKGVYSYY